MRCAPLRFASLCAVALALAASTAHAGWTPWLDRDDADGPGDYEKLAGHIADGNVPCPDNVVGVEARRKSDGVPWFEIAEFNELTVEKGFKCINYEDYWDTIPCSDYEVRFDCGPMVEAHSQSGVDENFDHTALGELAREIGIILGQTVSHNGGDAGNLRFNGALQVKFQESDNGAHGNEDVDIVAFVGPPSALGIDGETGSFSHAASGHADLVAVQFDGTYENPVFFAQVVTYGGSHPIIAVPVEVRADRAVVMLTEPLDYDGAHGEEVVHWAVFEAGTYQLDDGRTLLVGTVDVTTTDYDSDDMTTLAPPSQDIYYFADDSVVIAAPQSGTVAGYHGARVQKESFETDALRFGVRHMRRRDIEYAANPEATSGDIGYLVLGGPSVDYDLAFGVNVTMLEASPLIDGGDLVISDVVTLAVEQLDGSCGTMDYESNLVSQSDRWGNNVAGADYLMRMGLEDTRVSGGEVWSGGEANAHITLLGDDFTVFDIGAEATLDADDNSSNRMWLQALGGLIDYDEAAELSYTVPGAAITFFEASAVFYGVTVSGAAVGELGITFTAKTYPLLTGLSGCL